MDDGEFANEAPQYVEEDENQSPVEEVALCVSTTDDPSLEGLTFRMWIIGIVVCAFLSFINQYFWFRTASIIISPICAIIVTLYIGRFMAETMPTYCFTILGKRFTLNPGPFNVKEHVLISIFANCGSAFGNGNAYAIDIITIVRQFYGTKIGFFPAFLLIVTTQMLGYGWAGMLRKYLVDPAQMWWPINLVNVTLFRTLHEPDRPPKGKLKRIHFFGIVAVLSFTYYAVPDYMIPIVTSVSWLCWAFPNSVTMHQLGSGYYGLGLGSFALDWGTIESFLGTPLATPWFTIWNIFLGFVLVAWVVIPGIYWGNVYESKRYPILTSKLFRYSGKSYNVHHVIDADNTLNVTAYDLYGPPHLSGFFALSYGFGFAALTATVVHVALWYGGEIYTRTMLAAAESKPDIHTRMMRCYPVLPEWWFLLLLLVNVCVAIALLEGYKELQLPWWGLLLGCALSFFFTLPIGIITATTNQTPGLNIITEMVWGYLRPGQPIANVCFKTYGYISMTQAISFLSDFKLGHYMKIPPRDMFLVQLVGTIFAGLVNLGSAFWIYTGIENGNVCITSALPSNTQWTCPNAAVFFSASIIWGLVGPQRLFGPEGQYSALNWGFLIGAVAPLPFWALYKLFPKATILAQFNVPVILNGVGVMPPAGPVNYTSWFVMGTIFNYYVFKYNKTWWVRYNYVLSAALDFGLAVMTILVFAGVQMDPPGGIYLNWWGSGRNGLADQCNLARCSTASGALSIDPYCANYDTPNV